MTAQRNSSTQGGTRDVSHMFKLLMPNRATISCSWFKILHISTMNISKWLQYKNYSMLYLHDKAKRHRVTNNCFFNLWNHKQLLRYKLYCRYSTHLWNKITQYCYHQYKTWKCQFVLTKQMGCRKVNTK